jgi:hypothetical protein
MRVMKFIIAFFVSILACGLFVTNTAHSDSNNSPMPPDVGRQAWFLNLLKTLAGTHGLNDADKVGNILGVSFEKTVTNTSPSHAEAFAKSFERIDYTPNKPTWFQAGPIGYAYPGALGGNPPSDGKSIYFKYYYLERHGLPTESLGTMEFDSAKDDTESTIMFYGVSAFTCITLRDITSRFPSIHHMRRTDASSEAFIYYPPIDEEAGSVLSFAATEGQCLSEVHISEFSAFGKRHARAQYKFDTCLREAAKDFSQKQECWTPQEIEWHLRQECVNLNHFYENEPHSNEEPPPRLNVEIPQSHTQPCHYHD